METKGSVRKEDTDRGDAQSVKRLHRRVRPECRTQYSQKRPGTDGGVLLSAQLLPVVDTRESLFSCVTGILGVINLKTKDHFQDPSRLDSRELCRQPQLNKALLMIKQVP